MFWHQSVCLSTLVGGGVPHLRISVLVTGGYPISGLARGGTPSQGYPPDQVWMGYPPRAGMGYPLDLGPGTPPQHSEEHLICGGWYASCVHAGGLSCYSRFSLLTHSYQCQYWNRLTRHLSVKCFITFKAYSHWTKPKNKAPTSAWCE